jgi:hypothetical protein
MKGFAKFILAAEIFLFSKVFGYGGRFKYNDLRNINLASEMARS